MTSSMDAHTGRAAQVAVLNGLTAQRSTSLVQALQSCAALLAPAVRSMYTTSNSSPFSGRSQQAFASANLSASTSRSRQTERRPGFWHGFFSPPSMAHFASINAASAQMRIAARLAHAAVLTRGGELALEWDGFSADPGHKAHELSQEQVRSMFDEMDLDSDGRLSRDELLALVDALGLPCSSAYLGAKPGGGPLRRFQWRLHFNGCVYSVDFVQGVSGFRPDV
jgi:hypothetical protein